MWVRAGLGGDPLEEPHAFIDRKGVAHLTYRTALKWAQAFAMAEPQTVGLYLTDWEERLKAEGWQPGQREAHSLLRQQGPAYALVRSWCGEADREQLRVELERLRRLVQGHIGTRVDGQRPGSPPPPQGARRRLTTPHRRLRMTEGQARSNVAQTRSSFYGGTRIRTQALPPYRSPCTPCRGTKRRHNTR
jgi:hypothetical protein